VYDSLVDFVIGSLTVCSRISDLEGRASCDVAGPAPQFFVRVHGNAWHRPARATYTPNPLPPPLPDGPGFPACGHFDGAIGLVTGGDAHSETVAASTEAPPCPVVKYTAYGDGVVIGQKLGDLRATDLLGNPISGMAALFIERPFGSVGPSCVVLTATDSRNGQLLDTFPAPDAPYPCMPEVAGQKFR
jgi:hypothetical protein